MHVDLNHKQKIAWVMNGDRSVASFAFEEWGGANEASQAAHRFMERDPITDILEPFAEAARSHAADAPEWGNQDTVSVILTIGDLRAALAAYEEST